MSYFFDTKMKWIKNQEMKGKDWGILSIVIFVRLLFCLVDPITTSDLLRNIFYGKNFWIRGFKIYDLTPLEIDPKYNVIDPLNPSQLSWYKNTFNYPTLSLIFFSLIALFPSPILLAKLFFNIFDILNFFLIRKLLKKEYWYSWVYIFVSAPISSIEGQTTSVLVFIFLLSIWAYITDQKAGAYFLVALGIQWKYVTILLLPYFIIKDYYDSNLSITSFYSFFIPLLALSFPILFSGFVIDYILYVGEFPYDILPWNPLSIWVWSPAVILFAVMTIFSAFRLIGFRDSTGFDIRIAWAPFILLCVFFLVYKYAFPFYWLWFFPLLVILPEKDRTNPTAIFLGITLLIASVVFVLITVGVSGFISLIEGVFSGKYL